MKTLTGWATVLAGLIIGGPALRAEEASWYANATFSVFQEQADGHFWRCNAVRKGWDNAHLLNIAMALDGSVTLVVSGLAGLASDEATLSGSYQVDGGRPFSFDGLKLKNSTLKAGEKFAVVPVDPAFKDSLAKGRRLSLSLPKGTITFPLAGADDALQHLDDCLDAGAAEEPDERPAVALAAPHGWTVGADAGGAPFLSAANPANMEEAGFALVQVSPGNFVLRLRPSKSAMERGLDPAIAHRQAASIVLGGGSPLSLSVLRKGRDIDITGLGIAELGRLPSTGTIKVSSADRGASFAEEYPVGVDLLAAGKASLETLGVTPALSLEGLQGKFRVRGRNPDGQRYTGEAEAVADDQGLHISYTWSDGKTLKARGILLDNMLATITEGDSNAVAYRIGKDGYWRGTFADGKGVEVLIPK